MKPSWVCLRAPVIQANGRLTFEDDLWSGGLLYFTHSEPVRTHTPTRFWKNWRHSQAAAARQITTCPPRFSDPAPSLLYSISTVTNKQGVTDCYFLLENIQKNKHSDKKKSTSITLLLRFGDFNKELDTKYRVSVLRGFWDLKKPRYSKFALVGL